MEARQNDFFYRVGYYSRIVAKSFLIALFCLLVVIAFLAVIYLADLFLNVKSGNYNSPLFNGYVIVSKSMVPTININDAIIIHRSDDVDYEIGDIISFYSTEYDVDGMVVTHRIVRKRLQGTNDYSYTTKGDNNPIPDRKNVTSSNVYGKVLLIIPKLGYAQSFLSKPLNFALCILFPSLIIIIYDVVRIFVGMEKSKEMF